MSTMKTYTINEVRRAEGYPPIPDAIGDIPLRDITPKRRPIWWLYATTLLRHDRYARRARRIARS